MRNYPKYLTFNNRKNVPSVLNQAFPMPDPNTKKRYYPKNNLLQPHLATVDIERKFEIAQFYKFLKETIEVEHFLVIPAIANLNRLNFDIPNKAKEDLYKIATDEAFHAEQSLTYLNGLKQQFEIQLQDDNIPPIFIQKLELQKRNSVYGEIIDLLPILFGIITETRISIELGKFAKNVQLENSVREICLSHAVDEVVHSSQFQALGIWLWETMNEEIKKLVSASFIDALFYRNMPDLEALNRCFAFATNMSMADSKKIISECYSKESIFNEMLEVCKPTLKYLLKNNMVTQEQIDQRIAIEKDLLILN
jgi:hypothetical protein